MDVRLSQIFSQWREENHHSRILNILPEFDFDAVYESDELTKILHHFYLALLHSQQYARAAEIVQKYAGLEVTAQIQIDTDQLLRHLRVGKCVVGTSDRTRKPKAHEIVIVYGDYPCSADSLICCNPIYRNLSYLSHIEHDIWEADDCFDRLEAIFIVSKSAAGFSDGCRQLARIRAPVQKAMRIDIDPTGDDLETMSRTLREVSGLSGGIVLVLHEGFIFPENWNSRYFGRLLHEDFSYCPIHYESVGHFDVHSDVMAVARKRLPKIRAYLFQARLQKHLKEWADQQLQRIGQGRNRLQVEAHFWDWLTARGLKVSRRKLCFYQDEITNTGG